MRLSGDKFLISIRSQYVDTKNDMDILEEALRCGFKTYLWK